MAIRLFRELRWSQKHSEIVGPANRVNDNVLAHLNNRFRCCVLRRCSDAIINPPLQNLKQIKEMQHQRDSGEWRSLSPPDLQKRETALRTNGSIARFFNVMSNESMNILKFITSGEWLNKGQLALQFERKCAFVGWKGARLVGILLVGMQTTTDAFCVGELGTCSSHEWIHTTAARKILSLGD